MSTSARFMTGAIWSGVTGVRLLLKKFVINEPSAASTLVLPAGVLSVSSTGSASSSELELRAASPVPPTVGNRRAASSTPATTIEAASFARVVDREGAFSDIGDEGTWPDRWNAEVSRGAR